jgi:CelD/BcsL family acetyltransferase involved in cellulose biosynthesis
LTLTGFPASLDTEAVCTDTAFSDAAPAWRSLWTRLDVTPFLSPEWHAAWWRTLPEGTPELIVLRRHGETVALAPFVRRGETLRFSGGDLSDVRDVLALDDAACDALAAAVVARDGALVLDDLLPEARVLGRFADALRRAGYAVSAEPVVVSPRIELRASFEEQLARLSKKDRHELRRKLRRLDGAGAVAFHYVAPADLDAALDRFVAWHRAAPGEKGRFLTPERERFFREAARAGMAAGWCRFGELRLDGRAIAALFAVERGARLAAYNSAADPAAAALSPGILLHAHAMRDAIARGLRVYDLLRGDEPYKYDLGAKDVPLRRLVARRA